MIEVYQEKHYLQYLLQKKKSDLKKMKLRLDFNEALFKDNQYDLNQLTDVESEEYKKDKERLD